MAKNNRFSVAPMMDWTDKHCRYFHRLLNKDVVLYTEMVTTGALIHGDTKRFLDYNHAEHPVVLQIGGSDPEELSRAATLAEEYKYDEINLNCGCPSERVQKGAFGACLMAEPDLVANCLSSMNKASALPVTLKCRIGIDNSDEYEFLERFVNYNTAVGCNKFFIHARKAWLKGLSPKDNREIPPLNYERVYRLKQEHPDLEIHINGGIKTLEEIHEHLKHVDGVMIGREAYYNPLFLNQIEREFSQTAQYPISESDVVMKMMSYAQQEIQENGAKLHDITRHMMGLFHRQNGARLWRQHLSSVSKFSKNDPEYIVKFINQSM